ncbi:hypothetical protein D9757_008895 [Collybiopsis confluens]|uniref:Peptidase A1 domain-containing protein n=1 Tax=Collybiopsis confluens TaxID=2823264 RepID=A0A8H5H4V4_9AGAR|nr:hypothetical protein D9757_008895 [Collybiopsis confluens]
MSVHAQDKSLVAVKAAFKAAQIPEDIFFTFDPTVLLEVTLPQPSGESITLHAGINLPRNATAGPPSFAVVGPAGKGPFVIAAVDPDAPTPQAPTNAEIRHFLGGNFVGSRGEPESLTNSTPAISEFRQPTPPAGSDAHRYTFLIFNQPRGFNNQTLVNSTTSVSNFNLSSFALATGLGQPIGGTFMLLRTLTGLALLLLTVNATPTVRRHDPAIVSRVEKSLPPADFSIAIAGSVPRSKAKKSFMQALRASQSGSNFTTVVGGSDFDEEYLTNVTVGLQDLLMIVDTGSSDTWVPQVGFSCFDLENNPVPQSQCAFGTDGFNTSDSPTFKLNPNTNFNITYGDGEFLSGESGFDTVIVANMKGADPAADQFPETQIPYNPFFYSAVQQGVVSHPFFSVALDRGSFAAENNSLFDENLGFIAFGGIAPVPVTRTQVTVPIQGYDAATFLPENKTHPTYFYYTIDVESMSFTGNKRVFGTTNRTTLNYVPTNVANAFAAAFDPPAVFDDDFGVYVVVCSAKVPEFTVNIAGKVFTVDRADNLLPLGIQDGDGNDLCASGTSGRGDTFIHNSVLSFDIEAKDVTITQRQPYSNGGEFRRTPAALIKRARALRNI